MRINIRLSEPFWRVIEQRNITLDLEAGDTVSDLMVELRRIYPSLSRELDASPPVIIAGDDEVNEDFQLQEDSQLYLMWPIAGG